MFFFKTKTGATIALAAVLFLFSYWHHRSWEKQVVFGGDGWGYYAYLPALFIHGDLPTLEKTLEAGIPYGHPPREEVDGHLKIDVAHHVSDGRQVIKYTSGIAMAQLPFFLVAHTVAPVLGHEQDGFSPPYIVAFTVASLFYVLIGFVLLSKVLRRYFSDGITALVVFILAAATNLYFFSVYLTPMSHAILFFLYCALLFSTCRFYEKPDLKSAFWVGLCCGFIGVTRPNEVICVLIPLFYGVGSFHTFQERGQFLGKHWTKFLLATFAFLLPILPQVVYWQIQTGSPIFYSYPGESFDFSNPKILDGWFHYQNGWLIYTPVMAFALFGLFALRKNRDWLWPILTFFPLFVYVTYCWWCWHYINGFGSRPMVETYALLSIPLGYAIRFLWKKRWRKILFGALFAFFTALNLFQTWQFSEGLLWTQETTRAFYWEMFGKSELTPSALIAFDTRQRQPDPEKLEKVNEPYFNDFENEKTKSQFVKNGSHAYEMNDEVRLSPVFSASLSDIGARAGDWVKYSGWYRGHGDSQDYYHMSRMVLSFKIGGRKRERFMRVENKIPRWETISLFSGKGKQWAEIGFFAQVPPEAQATDSLRAFVRFTPGRPPITFDDLRVEVFRPR